LIPLDSVCCGVIRWREDRSAFDDRHDVVLAHDQDLFLSDLDFGAGELAKEDLVANVDVEGANLAVVQALAVADRREDSSSISPLNIVL
jgi:hypothetical protein